MKGSYVTWLLAFDALLLAVNGALLEARRQNRSRSQVRYPRTLQYWARHQAVQRIQTGGPLLVQPGAYSVGVYVTQALNLMVSPSSTQLVAGPLPPPPQPPTT